MESRPPLIDFERAESLVLDDLGAGSNSAYNRQILQEILDRQVRLSTDRVRADGHEQVFAGRTWPQTFADDLIPSRLAGMCTVVQIHGPDGRLTMRKSG